MELGHLAAVWSKLTPPAALIFNFFATWREGSLTSSEESLELGWFTSEEALLKVTHPVNRDRLQTLLNFDGRIVYRAYTPKPHQLVVETFLT